MKLKQALTVICGAAIILYFLGPFIAVSLVKTYWVLFRNSNICTIAQSWEGLNEFMRIKETSNMIAARSRLLAVDRLGLQEWSTPLGKWWFPRGSAAWTVHFAMAQFKHGAYPGLQIHSGDIVLDCGGYVGDWTKWALQAGAAKVVTLEPAADALECARRNLAEEIRKGHVILYPKGVWDSESVLYLNHVSDNPAANTVVAGPEVADGELIEVATIDRIVGDLGLKRLDVIKMDIEGAEIRAIHGAVKTLNRFHPRLAVATEHTQDVLKNNRDVLKAIREIAPFYRESCGYCNYASGMLIPETLYFSP